jgi:hypothetical protein
MKAGTLLQDVEGVALLAGLAITTYLVWKGYSVASGGASTVKSIADKASQIYTSARTSASNAVTESEIAIKKLISGDATIYSSSGDDGRSTRQDAVNLLNGLRTAKAVTETNIFNAHASLWGDFKDWYSADTTGKAVRESFYAKNPDGVFYD